MLPPEQIRFPTAGKVYRKNSQYLPSSFSNCYFPIPFMYLALLWCDVGHAARVTSSGQVKILWRWHWYGSGPGQSFAKKPPLLSTSVSVLWPERFVGFVLFCFLCSCFLTGSTAGETFLFPPEWAASYLHWDKKVRPNTLGSAVWSL